MKVIAINGSPRFNGNTSMALKAMTDELERQGIETETIQIGNLSIRGCIACGHCRTSEGNKCVFKDDCVNDVAQKMREADGFILGCPTYYAGIPGTMKSFLDRVFYSSTPYFRLKVGTTTAVVRRAGGVDVVHQLNNYLNLAQMVIPPSQYWTIAYGRDKGEVEGDGEGMQTLVKNARSMAWLLKLIEAGKDSIPLPENEPKVVTSFIR
ncbi:MAG: flavodoxin family protein [Firmicutes bacterium HGW-Firmicutes-9]|jgi:multimeric flavodoxin WrbA|nr:MAG: flavodoxin family protein [Firmicutes bacterium HGW-Firmicutes-9]